MRSWRPIALLLFGVGAALAGSQLGDGYIQRLPDHRGFYLIGVDDQLAKPLEPRPRHAVIVLFDGLRQDFARKMRSMEALREKGRCAVTDVGPLTVSRPVYAVLSTGLEQDRTGSRNNDETSPLAAESFWEVARREGRAVTAISGVPWWQQLFPRAFSAYRVEQEPLDFFAAAELADLTLIHPDYVDHAGHSHGAASPEYAQAAERADRELAELLRRVDLSQDLVVVTADHGHSARGGHGGPHPEIREVLTCAAGRGVLPGPEMHLTMRALGPAIAMLIGLPFPRHMRAGQAEARSEPKASAGGQDGLAPPLTRQEDELDRIFELAAGLPPDHLADRRQAVLRFRRENAAVIPSWSEHYAGERRLQWARALPSLVVLAFVFAKRRKARTVLFAAAIFAATAVVYTLARGTFDFTSVNRRDDFVHESLIVCTSIGIAVAAIHAAFIRSMEELLIDQAVLTASALILMVAHIHAFGWPIGFPLPPAALLFVPFLGGVFLAAHGAILALVAFLQIIATSKKHA